MARDWLMQDVDRWVERWWDSGLTSLQFVVEESLPISARTLRSHGARHFAHVLRELRELRAIVAALGIVVLGDGEPDQSACDPTPSTDAPPAIASQHPVKQVGTRAVSALIFDPDDDPTASADVSPASDLEADEETGQNEAAQEGLVAGASGAPHPVVLELSDQLASHERASGPFLFDVEIW